jgi:hypothetical protein
MQAKPTIIFKNEPNQNIRRKSRGQEINNPQTKHRENKGKETKNLETKPPYPNQNPIHQSNNRAP